MQTYGPVAVKFPGLSSAQTKWLEDQTAHINETERDKVQQELYRKVLPITIARKFKEDRIIAKNELYAKSFETKDAKQANTMQSQVRMEDLADIVKEKRGLKVQTPTEVVMKGLVKDAEVNGVNPGLINDFLAGKGEEFLYQMGFKERPKKEQEQGGLKGMLSRAGGDWGDGEWFNPIGKATEFLDNLVQHIPTVSFEGREEELRKRIDAVGEDERKAFEDKFNTNRTLQVLYGNVDNYIAENKKGFWDHFWGVGESGPAVSKMIANAPVSALKTLSGTARAITNPLDSITGIVKILGSEEGRELLKQRYGENLAQTMNDDPVGLASDILAIIQAGAGIGAKGASLIGKAETASKLAGISQTAGTASDLGANLLHNKLMGGLEKVSNMGKVGNVVGTALEVSQEPLKVIGKMSEPLKEGVTRTIPEKVVENQMKLTPRERATVEATGITPAQFVLKENIGGLSKNDKVVALQNIANDAYKTVSDGFSKIPETEIIKNSAFKEMLGVMIDEMKSSPIVVRKYKDFIEILEKLEQADGYTPQEGLAIRRDFDAIVGKKIFDTQGRVSGLEDEIIAGYRATASDVLEEVAQKYGLEMKEQNSRIRNAITIRDGLLRSISQSKKNNYFGLQDLGVGAILGSADPVLASSLIIGKKAVEKFAPGISQKLFNLNKSPIENPNIKKGASFINKGGKNDSRFNLMNNSDSRSTSPQGQERPVENLEGNIERSEGKGLDKLREGAETKYQLAGQTTSDNFKKWFGDWENDPKNASKVVNEKGEPLVVYHGTNSDFTTFDTVFGRQPIFLTSSKSFAQKYGGKQMPLYVDMKKPLEFDFKGADAFDDISFNGKTFEGIEDFANYAKRQGYDGVIAKNISDYGKTTSQKSINTEYIVFEPNQIKSATDNIGAFDSSNPDIRYQKHGVANPLEKDISAQRATQIQNIRNGKSVEQIAKDYGVDIKIVDKITTPEGLRAYGKYSDGIITLAEKIKEGTAPHELFHATFDLVDSNRKENILKQIRESKGLDNLNAEEYLADSFSEYFRTGKFDTKSFGKGLVEKIKQYFYQVKQFITGANKNKAQIKKLFDEILDGEIDRDMLGESLGNKKSDATLNQLQEAEGSLVTSPKKSIQINPNNARDFKKSLNNINVSQLNPESFLITLKQALGVGGESSYINNTLGDGIYTLRVSNHNANARNHKVRGNLENNTSVVIKLSDSRFKAKNGVDLIEFVYDPANLTPEKMQGIIKGVQDWIDTGEYTDKGYDHTHKSIRATLENGEVKYQRVYHGSPYEFKQFDSAHMGKGAGYQNHGWGHYVAVDKEVGKAYSKGGNLYEVEVPDPVKANTPTGSNYLEEADFLERKTIIKLFEPLKDWAGVEQKNFKNLMSELKSSDRKFFGVNEAYNIISRVLESKKEASKYLNSLGYDGIHFFGGDDGEAYVIFDDNKLEIKKHEKL